MKYKIAISGSTKNTVAMAKTIASDSRFEIIFTLSPAPKLIGRKQIVTKNPLHVWSEEKEIKTFLIEKKIEKTLLSEFAKAGEIDFLLVVDFGYLIPKWLLKLPKIAPLNIHPSLLPKWRGSSPGQFCLLFQGLDENDGQSAVTLMIMNEGLDQGPIIAQIPFKLQKNWTQTEYYQKAFSLISEKLGDLINDFAQGKILAKEQTAKVSTIIAHRLNKEDSFISWQNLEKLMGKNEEKISLPISGSALLHDLLIDEEICQNKLDQIKLVSNACRAFYPWPNLWTIVQTNKGEKRMKILACHLENDQLILDEIQIEGKNSCSFNECKNALI
jgi:methionyl-tRNA formyltransferase